MAQEDHNEENQTAKNESSENKEKQTEPLDWLLQALVEIINKDERNEISITLSVPGAFITGMLISGKRYFKLLSQAMPKETGMGEVLDGWSKEIYEDNPEQSEQLKTFYLHMREAKIQQSFGDPIPEEGMLWRSRISEVSGFAIGKLGHPEKIKTPEK